MALDAGSVSVTLKGDFSPAAFEAFGRSTVKAKTQMETAEKGITASSGRVTRSVGSIAKSAVGFTAAYVGIRGVEDVLVGTVSKAADFEQQMSALGAVTGRTGKGLDAFKKSAIDAGAATKYSALQAAQAQTELAKGGLSASQILGGGLKAALSLASAGELELADAATVTVNAMKNFGIEGSKSGHIADALAKAANVTTADVSDFATALTEAGGTAHTAGVSFDSTVAALEALAHSGTKGSLAGGSLKSAILAILTPSKQQTEAATKAGFAVNEQGQAFITAGGKLESFSKISEQLRDRLGGMTKAQRTATLAVIGGSYGVQALNALYAAGPKGLEAYAKGLNDTGYANKVAAEKQDNFKGKLENFKGSIETLQIVVGSKLLPALSDAADAGTKFVNEMQTGKGVGGDFASALKSVADHAGDANSELAQLKETAAPVVSVLGDIGGAAGKAEGHLALGKIKDDITGLAGAFELLDGIFTASPTKIFGGLEKMLGGVTSSFLGTFSTILSGAATFAGAMSHIPGIGGAFKDVAAGAQAAADAIDGVRDHLRHLGDVPIIKITADEGDAIDALQHVEHLKLDDKVMKILGKDVSASSKVKQIEHLGIDDKTAKILANIAPALAGVSTAKAAIAGIKDHTVVVNVITRGTSQIGSSVSQALSKAGKHATGRGPGGAETALVGEGNGPELVGNPDSGWTWVTQPTLMGLAPGDAVIPSDPQYAGRALAFMFSAMGIPGYAAGRTAFGSTLHPTVARKPTAKKVLPVPAAVKYGAVSEDDLKNSRDNARESYQKRKERVHNLDVSIREQRVKVREAKAGKAKRAAQAKLDQLGRDRHHYNDGGGGLASVNTLHNRYLELNREVGVLHRYNLDIDRLNTRQETDRTRMDTASKTGNVPLGETAAVIGVSPVTPSDLGVSGADAPRAQWKTRRPAVMSVVPPSPSPSGPEFAPRFGGAAAVSRVDGNPVAERACWSDPHIQRQAKPDPATSTRGLRQNAGSGCTSRTGARPGRHRAAPASKPIPNGAEVGAVVWAESP